MVCIAVREDIGCVNKEQTVLHIKEGIGWLVKWPVLLLQNSKERSGLYCC